MVIRSLIYTKIENIIKKLNGIENLPESEEIMKEINLTDSKIKELISKNKANDCS